MNKLEKQQKSCLKLQTTFVLKFLILQTDTKGEESFLSVK